MSSIAVVSGKGGSGKTFTAINIACGLKMLGKNSLLVDCSFGIRNVDLCVGAVYHGIYNIRDLVMGDALAEDVIIKSEESYMPDFIPCSAMSIPDDFKDNFKECIEEISSEYDYVVFDTPCAIGNEFEAVVDFCDTVIAVTTDDFLSVSNTSLCLARIDASKQKFILFNKVSSSGYSGDEFFAEDISDETGAKILGIIKEDEFAYKSLKECDPIVRYDTYSGREFGDVCKRLVGEYVMKDRKLHIFDRNRFVLK